MTVQTDVFWGAAETPQPGFDMTPYSRVHSRASLGSRGEMWDMEHISSSFHSATLCLLKGGGGGKKPKTKPGLRDCWVNIWIL